MLSRPEAVTSTNPWVSAKLQAAGQQHEALPVSARVQQRRPLGQDAVGDDRDVIDAFGRDQHLVDQLQRAIIVVGEQIGTGEGPEQRDRLGRIAQVRAAASAGSMTAMPSSGRPWNVCIMPRSRRHPERPIAGRRWPRRHPPQHACAARPRRSGLPPGLPHRSSPAAIARSRGSRVTSRAGSRYASACSGEWSAAARSAAARSAMRAWAPTASASGPGSETR